jgi:uncharacterized protein YgfB (UPF0149 family)
MDFNFEQVDKELGEFSFDAAEMHGIITGTLCSTNNVEKAIQAVEGGENDIIKNLSQKTLEQLKDDSFAFQLLLPSDETPLSFRTESMALWAQGFLSGLGEGALAFEKDSKSELREMFDDVVVISQADTDVEENDESEQYYADVTEYLRIIVMTFYLEVLRTKLPQDKDR